jgi:tetratricopeptide (TPR) repeat protein
MMRVLAALIALATLLQRFALADEAESEARRHFVRGKQLYDQRKYHEAAEEFENGYAIFPKPGFLINIGHCYRRTGDLKKARRYYQLFLDKDSSSPQREEVQAYIKTLEETLADQGETVGDDHPAASPPTPPPAPRPPEAPPVHLDRVERVDQDDRAAAAPAAQHPVWPWLVSGAAVLIAGGITAFVLIAHPGRGSDCGATLGCTNER